MRDNVSRGFDSRLLLATLLAGLSLGCDVIDKEVTVYRVVEGKGPRIAFPRQVYKASFETQTVVTKMPGAPSQIDRLRGCVVFDSKNWTCKDPDDPDSVTAMADGTIVKEKIGFLPDARIQYVGKLRWLLIDWGILK